MRMRTLGTAVSYGFVVLLCVSLVLGALGIGHPIQLVTDRGLRTVMLAGLLFWFLLLTSSNPAAKDDALALWLTRLLLAGVWFTLARAVYVWGYASSREVGVGLLSAVLLPLLAGWLCYRLGSMSRH